MEPKNPTAATERAAAAGSGRRNQAKGRGIPGCGAERRLNRLREQSPGMTSDSTGSRIIPDGTRREIHQGVAVKLRNLLIDLHFGIGPAGPGVAGFQEI